MGWVGDPMGWGWVSISTSRPHTSILLIIQTSCRTNCYEVYPTIYVGFKNITGGDGALGNRRNILIMEIANHFFPNIFSLWAWSSFQMTIPQFILPKSAKIHDILNLLLIWIRKLPFPSFSLNPYPSVPIFVAFPASQIPAWKMAGCSTRHSCPMLQISRPQICRP